MKNNLVAFIFLFLTFTRHASSQDSPTNGLRYEVNRVYPSFSITEEKLKTAHTLTDLNKHYQSSWIREYIVVEILTNYKGRTRKAFSKNDTISQEQKDIMQMADLGTDISVNVQYIPENTLKYNPPRKINFTFSIDPECEAKYPGGQHQLRQYLKEKAIDKISDGSFKKSDLTAVKFTIDEEGKIIDPHIFWSSEDEKVDKLLLKTISNMPSWQPAEYSNGLKVKQEFVLTVGNTEGC